MCDTPDKTSLFSLSRGRRGHTSSRGWFGEGFVVAVELLAGVSAVEEITLHCLRHCFLLPLVCP